MISTHKLDQVYGLREILTFDGEAPTSKHDIKEKLVLGSKSRATVTVEEMSFEIQKMSRVVISGYVRRFLYRQLLSINKSFS